MNEGQGARVGAVRRSQGQERKPEGRAGAMLAGRSLTSCRKARRPPGTPRTAPPKVQPRLRPRLPDSSSWGSRGPVLGAARTLSVLCHPRTGFCCPFCGDYVPHGAAAAQTLAGLGATETDKPTAAAPESSGN